MKACIGTTKGDTPRIKSITYLITTQIIVLDIPPHSSAINKLVNSSRKLDFKTTISYYLTQL